MSRRWPLPVMEPAEVWDLGMLALGTILLVEFAVVGGFEPGVGNLATFVVAIGLLFVGASRLRRSDDRWPGSHRPWSYVVVVLVAVYGLRLVSLVG